jgi:hypothetical protein
MPSTTQQSAATSHDCLPAPWLSTALLTLILLTGLANSATAQLTAADLTRPDLTDAERKEATLLWLDKYLADSVLMSQENTAKIRQAVEQMSPTQLTQWLQQTTELAEYVESPAWQDTKTWLRSFLRVQNMYSDEQIKQLRNDILNADSQQMLQILKGIQEKHESLTWMHGAYQQMRATEVQQRNASVAEQSAAAARSRRSSASMPLFGQGMAKGSKPSKGYRPPKPLITSRQVARATVWREAMGGGWGYGF